MKEALWKIVDVLLSAALRAKEEIELAGLSIGKEVERTDGNKRQVLLGKWVREFMIAALHVEHIPFTIEFEGWKPLMVCAPEGKTPILDIRVDPLDGTASLARLSRTQARMLSHDFAAVVTIAPFKDDLCFKDLLAAGVLNFGSGQRWMAVAGEGVRIVDPDVRGEFRRYQKPERPNCDMHALRIHVEHFRRVNGLARWLLPYHIENVDMPSSALNILLAALGEGDIFMNNPLPSLDGGFEGQRGHELGIGYVFCREVGGRAIDTRTGNDLGETPYTFDGMTPVILGAYPEVVEKYRSIMERESCRLLEEFESEKAAVVLKRLRASSRSKWYSLPFVPSPHAVRP